MLCFYLYMHSKGLKINNKDMIYWEDGMFLRHEMGHFMLESVQVSQREGYITHGILITVQSLEEDYSIMGMIVDAVEDLLSDHYPGINGQSTMVTISRYILLQELLKRHLCILLIFEKLIRYTLNTINTVYQLLNSVLLFYTPQQWCPKHNTQFL